MALRARARINLAAIERNVAQLRSGLAGGCELCAVVKANASGHGAVPVARAALAAGATRLAVATALEAAELRDAGLTAPILIMGARQRRGAPRGPRRWGRAGRLEPGVRRRAGRRRDGAGRVHVKLDSGMGRLGTRDLAEALAVADRVLEADRLQLVGAMTHLATADGDRAFMTAQLAAFAPFATAMRERAPGLTVHAANSAATVREPASHSTWSAAASPCTGVTR